MDLKFHYNIRKSCWLTKPYLNFAMIWKNGCDSSLYPDYSRIDIYSSAVDSNVVFIPIYSFITYVETYAETYACCRKYIKELLRGREQEIVNMRKNCLKCHLNSFGIFKRILKVQLSCCV